MWQITYLCLLTIRKATVCFGNSNYIIVLKSLWFKFKSKNCLVVCLIYRKLLFQTKNHFSLYHKIWDVHDFYMYIYSILKSEAPKKSLDHPTSKNRQVFVTAIHNYAQNISESKSIGKNFCQFSSPPFISENLIFSTSKGKVYVFTKRIAANSTFSAWAIHSLN